MALDPSAPQVPDRLRDPVGDGQAGSADQDRNPTGVWLASAGDDGTVRMWDPTTGTLLATLVASEEGWAALLPDGSYKLHGQPAGLWWAIGLCRFDPADLPDISPYQPQLQHLPDATPIRHAVGR